MDPRMESTKQAFFLPLHAHAHSCRCSYLSLLLALFPLSSSPPIHFSCSSRCIMRVSCQLRFVWTRKHSRHIHRPRDSAFESPLLFFSPVPLFSPFFFLSPRLLFLFFLLSFLLLFSSNCSCKSYSNKTQTQTASKETFSSRSLDSARSIRLAGFACNF